MIDILTTLKQHLPITRSPRPSPYECQVCGTRFDTQRQVCPACGSYTIERIDWPRSTTESQRITPVTPWIVGAQRMGAEAVRRLVNVRLGMLLRLLLKASGS
jgi:ribosomal protein L37E